MVSRRLPFRKITWIRDERDEKGKYEQCPTIHFNFQRFSGVICVV